jgi:DNA invertase Pin-like site-specific DNA recombinase
MTKRVAFYLRVSTDAQTTENQQRDLQRLAEYRGWTVVGEYRDQGISGAAGRDKRPELDRLLKDAARRRFDVVAFWAVDRLGRSTGKVATIMEELDALGVQQFYHKEAIDTSTPHGRAMLQMAAVFAELERGMIRERVIAGLERARAESPEVRAAKGKKAIGRPTLPENLRRTIVDLRGAGKSIREVAKGAGVSTATVQKVLKDAA